MRTKRTILYAAVAVLVLAALARAQTPAELFTTGEALLAKGELKAALQSYAAAVRADRGNPEYVQHYVMVRRVVDLRSRLESEQDAQRWEYSARALRAFYVTERLYPEILSLDQRLHARLNSTDSAAMLADTQLAMGRDAEAVQTLSSLEPGRATEMTHALLGIALVRTGKAGQARLIAERLSLASDAGPALIYAAARLHAATGDSAKAIGLLKACFEATLPSLQDAFKSHATECPEFASLAATPDFARVLETKSKVPESKCSGGSSCAGCPMSGKCPKSQARQQTP